MAAARRFAGEQSLTDEIPMPRTGALVPDCVFRRGDLKTADPDLWAKLKVEYERQCYQAAEKRVRGQLARLQAASRCETDPAIR